LTSRPASRRAAAAGIAGPVGFLGTGFLLAALRHDLIVAQGWKSWPSSMALGGPPAAIPQICAFLWLTACYTAFALGALRPVLRLPSIWAGFLAIAAGDALLAFPTDAPDAGTSWHGTLHLVGILVVTVATLVAAAGVTRAASGRPGWRAWRWTLPVPFAATAIGLVGGLDAGWAKVAYVVGITVPAAVIGILLLRETYRAPTAARSG
jgi:hypothetical protein